MGARDLPRHPIELPPLSCDRPEYAPFLRAHWGYVLNMDDTHIPIYPTGCPAPPNILEPDTIQIVHDGGFTIHLEDLPLERLNVPRFSGRSVRYVHIQYGEYDNLCPTLGRAVKARLAACLEDARPAPSTLCDHLAGLHIPFP